MFNQLIKPLPTFLFKVFAFVSLLFSSTLFADQDNISGTYSGNNRFAMFEKLKSGDVRFYISGIQVGSSYPCTIGDDNVSVLSMNGSTGGFTDNSNIISVEFGKSSARVIVEKSKCIVDGTYKKTGGKKSVNWSEGGD